MGSRYGMGEEDEESTRRFDTDEVVEDARTVRILPDYAPPVVPYDTSQLPPRNRAVSQPSTSVATSQAGQAPVQQVTHVHKGPSTCAIVAGTLAILLLACGLLAFATLKDGLSGLGKLGGIFPSFSGLVTTPTVTIDTSKPAVIDRVRALSRLETVHYQLEKVVTGKSTGPLPDFLTSDKILLVAHGEVIGGVDLGKMAEDDISVMSDTVTVRLPQAEILLSKLDNSKTYVYDRQTGIFSQPDPQLETQIRIAAEQEIVKAAMEDGILDKAQRNAEDVIRSLVEGLGYEQVRFVASKPTLPTATPAATP